MVESTDRWRKLYTSPKWYAFRKKIFKRDKWRCTVCGGKYDLQAHHTYYVNNKLPWSYPPESVITLCGSCHHKYHIEHENIFLKKFPPKKKYHKKKRKKVSE